MEIMKEHAKGLSGVIHCYSYSKEMAQEYIKMGFYIGVAEWITFKNAKKLKEVVENIPLTSIVLETDCPYMAAGTKPWKSAIILLISVMWQ